MYKKYSGIIFAIVVSILVFVYRESFVNLKEYGLIGIFLISVLGNATIILPVPVVLTAFIGGSIYNPILVSIITAFGATIGEMTGYLAGTSGREVISNDQKVQKIKFWMDKYGLWAIFALAAIPNPLFDVAGIIAGAYKIPVYKYVLVVFLGKLIKFALLAYMGSFVLH